MMGGGRLIPRARRGLDRPGVNVNTLPVNLKFFILLLLGLRLVIYVYIVQDEIRTIYRHC